MSIIPNFTPYTKVLVILKREGQSDTDLSEAWSTIEYEDGLPQSVKITLNGTFGLFMTKDPIIVKFDKIFVQITDARGNVIQDVFQVKTLKRSRRPGKNKQLTLFCPHQSENLWSRTISLVAKRTSGFDALNKIINQLNVPQNRGIDDPTIEVPTPFDITRKVGNLLDPNTANNYIFEVVKLKTATDEITDIEQQPVEGGGSFEAIYIRFKSKYDHDNPSDTDLNTVQLQAFPQGFQNNNGVFSNIPNVTLIHQPLNSTASPKTNILNFDSNEDPELATTLHVVGDRNSGSYPVDFMQFQGAKDVFNNVKFWAVGNDYVVGNLVKGDDLNTYECIQDNTSIEGNRPPSSFWIQRFFVKPDIWNFGTNYVVNDLVIRVNTSWKCIQNNTADDDNEPPNGEFWVRIFFAPFTDYSPLTKANTQVWVNALAGAPLAVDATDANQGRVCIVDPNVIIDDIFHPRTMVRQVIPNPDQIPSKNKIAGVDIPDAYRVLAIDPNTGGSPTSGPWVSPNVDRNGVEFSGNILEFVDPDLDGTGEFVVFKSRVTGDDQEVFEYETALPWINNPCNPVVLGPLFDRFVDNSGVCRFVLGGGAAPRDTVWVIGSYGISQIPSIPILFPIGGDFGVFRVGKQMECAHSVQWDFDNHHIDMGTTSIIEDDVDGDSAVFIKTQPTIEQGIKDANPFFIGFNFHSLTPLTGQDDSAFPGSGAAGSDIALPTFDFNNMFRDHFGVESWFGPQSEDYLPIQGFAFWLQFLVTRNSFLELLKPTEGDFSLGIWMMDRRDNVRIIDDLTQSRKNDTLSQKGNLPGKAYKGVPGASQFFQAQKPDTTDAFDPREFLMGGIYTRDSFDGDGRYIGLQSRFSTASELQMNMDAYRMIKPLLATNVDILQDKPTRNIGTQLIKKQSIVSYAQLKNLVLGLDKIFNFPRRKFKEGTGGRCDIQFGDSVYYTDSEEINDTTDSLLNTIKGVNSKTTISLSKGKNGPGGFTSDYDLIERIWPD